MTPQEAEKRVAAAVQRACATWGIEAQLRMVQEECGELVAAINQFDRKRITHDTLAEEVADVIIAIASARYFLGTRVDLAVLQKLERLEDRLDNPSHVIPKPAGTTETPR